MQPQCCLVHQSVCIRPTDRKRTGEFYGLDSAETSSSLVRSAKYGSSHNSNLQSTLRFSRHPLSSSANTVVENFVEGWNFMATCVACTSPMASYTPLSHRGFNSFEVAMPASFQFSIICFAPENCCSGNSPFSARLEGSPLNSSHVKKCLPVLHSARDTSCLPPEALAKSSITTCDNEDFASTEEMLLTALKARNTEEAWQLHQVLRRAGVLPSKTCCSRLLAQLSHKGSPSSLSRAQKVLVDLQLVNELSLLDADAMGLLVMASARAGAARYALSITRVMLQMGMCPPVKVWSAVVSRLGKHPYDAALAIELFDEICAVASGEMVSVSLESGTRKEPDHGSTISSVYGKRTVTLRPSDIRPDTGAFNAVLNACATGACVRKAEELLERMSDFEIQPDVLTFNILIKLFAKAEEGDQLINILEQMEEQGVQPDLSTYNSLVSAYATLGDLDGAEQVVQSMKQAAGQSQQVKDGQKTVSQLEVRDGSTKASTWLEKLRKRDGNSGDTVKIGVASKRVSAIWRSAVKPDVRTYTTLMNGYVKQGRMKDAVQLLIAMRSEEDVRSHPNEVTYTTVIAACVNLGLMDEAKSVLLEMAAQKVPANLVTYNTLLKGYCSVGQVSKAYELIRHMKKAGLSPDVVSYNTLINGCIRRDDNVVALEVFREMRSAGVAPSEVSYTTLMNAFAKNGQPKLVAEVFEEMRQDPWMRIDVIAWNVLIDGYCRVGLMDAAKKCFNKMKEEGFYPTVATYGSLVKGYASAGQAGEALVLWNEIKERTMAKRGGEVKQLEPDGGLFDCLGDTCVRAGYFQRALEVVACMEQQGILADKVKYKRMFIELYSNLYTSKHASARRRARSADKRKAVDAFKFWLGLPNQYYQTEWTP